MKNESSRGPAKACVPVAVPSGVLMVPLTAGDAEASSFIIAPTTGGSTGPRTSTR